MKKIEFKVTIAIVDDTAVTKEVIKQALEDAMLTIARDRNVCYEVKCAHDGKLEQDSLVPFVREVPVNNKPYERIDPYDPPYSYTHNASQEK